MSSTKPSLTVRRLTPAEGLTSAAVIRAVRQALGDRPVAELNVAIVDDEQIARLHEEYMGDRTATDVLTFDLRDDDAQEAIEGEIVVSADTARREAKRRGLDRAEELTRYIIHGVLHLLGMDDSTTQDRQRMRREENRILKHLANPPGRTLASRTVPGRRNKQTRSRAGTPRRSSGSSRSSRNTR
jgi:probable rRNA maturation factor